MEKRALLYEGKAKRVYATDANNTVIQSFKDDATAFNAQKRGTITDKGIINNALSAHFFSLLESQGIETHFLQRLNERDMLCRHVSIIKIEVVTRNIAAGSLVKKYGFTEGQRLPFPIVEFYLKNDALGDPLINDDHARIMDLATAAELEFLRQSALKINAILDHHLYERGLLLVDFKLEFGRVDTTIILADEISPDTCRLWDKDTQKKLDKDRFRFDLGDVEDAYQTVYSRLLNPK